MEEPVFIACRRGAGERLTTTAACPRGAGRRLSPRIASRQGAKWVEIVLQHRVQRWNAEQIAHFPALPDVEEPVFTACRRNADKSFVLRVTCRRGNAGTRLSLGVACPRTKSCTAGTDSRVCALWMPRGRGKLHDQLVEVPKIEEGTLGRWWTSLLLVR